MVTCPACGTALDDDVWLCPHCEHVVRTEIIEPAAPAQTSDFAEDDELMTTPGADAYDVMEATTLTGEEAISEDLPDARIIGELDDETVDLLPAPVFTGAVPSISKVIVYASARSWRLLQPGAVPVVVPEGAATAGSELERLALALIDGQRTVHEIQRDSALPRNEIDGALLVLLDKGLIRLDIEAARDRPASVLEPVYPTEMTAEDAGEDPASADRTGPPRPRPSQRGGLPAPRVGSSDIPPMLDDDLLEEVFTPGPASVPNLDTAPRPLSQARPAPSKEAPPAPPEPPPPPTLAERIMEVGRRSDARARKLIDQASKDVDRGELLSAQTNLKLAMTFDPANGELRRLLAEVSREVPKEKRSAPKFSQRAQLLEQATEREARGDVDGAVEILERALRQSKDAAVYNRLGVILATKKKDVVRGRQLIEKAVELAPENETYKNNLSKVLARAAAMDIDERKGPRGGGDGIFGLFGKKK